MDNFKPTPSTFQSRVKLNTTYTSPKVDATLYCQLVGSLLYLTHTCPDLSFVIGIVARYMQHPMKAIGKKLKGHFAMFVVLFSLGYVTV